MTNQQNPQNNQKPSGESMLSKIGGGFSWWIGSLTGKPQVRKPKAQPQPQPSAAQPPAQVQAQAVPPQQSQPPAQASQPAQPPVPVPQKAQGSGGGDSVVQDIVALKNLVGKFSANVQKQAGPGVTKGVSSSQKAVSQLAQKAGKSGFLKNVLKIFFVILILMILALVAKRLFKSNPGGGGAKPTATPNPTKTVSSVTPTTFVFNPGKPSVYADDPEILQFEKDIDVLVREIAGTNIKETQLNPPILDYSVTF